MASAIYVFMIFVALSLVSASPLFVPNGIRRRSSSAVRGGPFSNVGTSVNTSINIPVVDLCISFNLLGNNRNGCKNQTTTMAPTTAAGTTTSSTITSRTTTTAPTTKTKSSTTSTTTAKSITTTGPNSTTTGITTTMSPTTSTTTGESTDCDCVCSDNE